MRGLRTIARAGALLVAALLVVPLAVGSPAAARGARADAVVIHVDSVSPSTPKPTTTPTPLVVTLTVTNTTSEPIDKLRILGERGDPIGNQTQLDDAIANPVAPTSGLPIPAHPELDDLNLAAHATATVEFSTTTSILNDGSGICICANADQSWIYPLFFSAHQVKDGVDNLLGLTSTYLPIFYQKPQPVRVSWLWPLLEAPHRFIDDTQFTDDTLADSVSGGRLSRALAVVEQVGPEQPMTLLIDPELLDELEVMAAGQYTVLSRDGKKTTPGTGQVAATAWLNRLHDVLQNDPDVTVQLTPYADPDVETLTERGRTWSTAMSDDMAQRVTHALAGRPLDSSLAWPVTGAIGKRTLHRLRADSVTTIVLNSSAVHVSARQGAVSPLLVRLPGPAEQPVIAPLLSTTIEKYAAKAVSTGGDGAAAIPTLVAELAVRAVEQPDIEQSVTIAAPRYVDPDVEAAVRTIRETSDSFFAAPISLADAVQNSTGTLVSTQVGQLAKVPAAATANLPAPMVAADQTAEDMKLVRSLLNTKDDADAAALVSALPAAVQRAESSGWRAADQVNAGGRYAGLLTAEFDRLATGVQVLGPSSGSYTLASNTSQLPITISNTLPYAVRVRVKIVPGPGFSSTQVGVQSIDATSTRTVKVPASTERSGLFKIEVLLQAPNRRPVGTARTIQVRSTALGIIGVLIMIVAGSVLGIALLWRIVRRLRQRKSPGAPPPVNPVPAATPEPVS